MLEDNLIYSLSRDPEKKDVAIIRNENIGSMCRKLESHSIPYRLIEEGDFLAGRYVPSSDRFNLVVLMFNLGLHAVPDDLRAKVEAMTEEMQPHVDAIGFYLGTCGNYEWNIPEWCRSKGYKPSAMFCDSEGNLCHDCVGVNIAGGPKYFQMEKRYPRCMYVFPAMATNYDDFMRANNKEAEAIAENLTPDMMEVLGIEPGQDGYMRWLLSLGDYKYLLRLDNGIGNENFDENLKVLERRMRLEIKDAEPGWASTQPTVDLYAKCKSFLNATRPTSAD